LTTADAEPHDHAAVYAAHVLRYRRRVLPSGCRCCSLSSRVGSIWLMKSRKQSWLVLQHNAQSFVGGEIPCVGPACLQSVIADFASQA
jgi:hypothetical protein